MKAIIYLRQSQDRDGEELGVTRQREDARKLADLRGWTVLAEAVDNDTTASGRKQRPGFETVLRAIDNGEAQAVIAWDMTRLTRNRRDTVRLMEAGEKHGSVLAFVRGSDLDLSTPAGRLTADILAGVARHEIEQKSDRQRRAALQAAQQGRRVGGRRPFAYEPDGVTLREDEAQALRVAYDQILRGVPLGRVASDLNAKGFLSPQLRRSDGGPSCWRAQNLRATLLNPRYAGLRAHVTKDLRTSMAPPKARLAGIVGPAEWPEVVAEEVWRAAVALICDPSRANPPRSGVALLTGIATCGVCGSLLHGGRQGGTGSRSGTSGYKSYRCRATYGHVTRRADTIDEYVRGFAVRKLMAPSAIELLHTETGPDVDALRRRAQVLRVRLDTLAVEFADGDLTASQLRAATQRMRDQLRAVESELADAGRVNLFGDIVGAADVAAVWDSWDTDRQRAAVRALMNVRVLPVGRGIRTFRPESVEIGWRV